MQQISLNRGTPFRKAIIRCLTEVECRLIGNPRDRSATGGDKKAPRRRLLIAVFLIGIVGWGEKVGFNIIGAVEAGTSIRSTSVSVSKFSNAPQQKSPLAYGIGLGFCDRKSGFGSERDAPSIWQNPNSLLSYRTGHRINAGGFVNSPINVPKCDFGSDETEYCIGVADIYYGESNSDRMIRQNGINLKLAHDDSWPMGRSKFVIGQPQLSLTGAPETIGRKPESAGKNGDGEGSYSRPKFWRLLTQPFYARNYDAFASGAVIVICTFLIAITAAAWTTRRN